MFMLFPLKGQKLVGNPCRETGVKTGKATLISMDKASPLRFQQAMAALWYLTMLSRRAGPSAKLSVAYNSLPELHHQVKAVSKYK